MGMPADTNSTAARIAQSVAALPPLPSTAQEILTCFGDEFIDADKVTSVVEGDPGICGKLLGLANSAYFGLANPVNDIGEAISRVLGVDTVRSLVLAMAIQRSFNRKNCPEFRTDYFWMRALLAAECCKKIALADESADDEVRDLAYSTGLCFNLGLMALVHIEPGRSNAVLKAFREQEGNHSLASFFHADFDTDHRIVTAELARNWSLPAPMIAAYQYRAFPNSRCDHRLGLVLMAGTLAVDSVEASDDRRPPLHPSAEALDMDPADLQKMATMGERQRERVESLVSNMAR